DAEGEPHADDPHPLAHLASSIPRRGSPARSLPHDRLHAVDNATGCVGLRPMPRSRCLLLVAVTLAAWHLGSTRSRPCSRARLAVTKCARRYASPILSTRGSLGRQSSSPS